MLGNHDTVQMVPGLEDMGIRMLLNECEVISRGNERMYLAGIDDAHFFRVENIEKAAANIPADAYSLLLSHTHREAFLIGRKHRRGYWNGVSVRTPH